MNDNLTEKQKDYIERIENYTKGLTAVSTGVCPGCEKCLEEYEIEIECECGGDDDCELCDGSGKQNQRRRNLKICVEVEISAMMDIFPGTVVIYAVVH